jgi:hypothetical protein
MAKQGSFKSYVSMHAKEIFEQDAHDMTTPAESKNKDEGKVKGQKNQMVFTIFGHL